MSGSHGTCCRLPDRGYNLGKIRRGTVTEHRTHTLSFLVRDMPDAGRAEIDVPTPGTGPSLRKSLARFRLCLIFCGCLSALLSAAVKEARAEDGFGFEPLAGSNYKWIEPYIGQLAAIPPGSMYFAEVETCTAVAISSIWILTAAHCIHVKVPEKAPWTPEYFAGVYPLNNLVFRSAPVDSGAIYKIVDYVKSERFPDPEAATEDWVFLKLDRALSIEEDRAPTIGLPRVDHETADMRIPGFIRAFSASGTEDLRASNLLQISRKGCKLHAHRDHLRGMMSGLLNADCIPPINPGLSGAPMIEFTRHGHERRANIVAIQMGSGRLEGSLEQVPVLVASHRFLDAYHRILKQNHPDMSSTP